MTWETVIGLEVHAQLSTKSKLFSTASTQYGAKPNAQTSYVDAGLPGVLPVLNQLAVEMAIQFGLAIQATLNNYCFFERKNYFYPDLPKGYQISQFQRPIVSQGFLDIKLHDGSSKSVIIERAHLEEDAGKSLHDAHTQYTGIDLNRAGTPLLEIVTTPCLHSAEEAICYLKQLHQLLRFIGICDGNMQEGSFRCDVNLSLRPRGETKLGARTELKNINSFRFIEKAIQFEQLRHQDILESGQTIAQETRLYNPDKNQTELMRSKENENDYRYFPDPDLLPIHITESELVRLKNTLPPLPTEIVQRLQNEDALSDDYIDFLLTSPGLYTYYNKVKLKSNVPGKLIVNWLKGHYAAALNELGLTFDNPPISTDTLAVLIKNVANNSLSNASAKKVFNQLLTSPQNINELIAKEQSTKLTDTVELERIIQAIIDNNPQQAADFRAGKDKLLGFFVGLVMKQTKGAADPSLVNTLILKYLSTT